MKIFYFIAAALFLPTFAHAEVVRIDVSGTGGRDGTSGDSGNNGGGGGYFSNGSNGDNGQDGSSGRDGESGTNAGALDLEVGFVPGSDGTQIYVRGTQQRPEGGTDQINRTFSTDNVSAFDFEANGGRGGQGGRGGSGGSGGDGGHGATGGLFSLDGGRGGNGGNGGRGGEGGRGGDGGGAGRIRVRVAAGSELLEPLVHMASQAGSRGSGGYGGEGGNSGSGGWGGSGSCETRNGKEECGSSGWSGSSGNRGTSGQSGGDGREGSRSNPLFLTASGDTIEGVYNIQTVRFNYDESIPDGVVEQGETLTMKSVVLANNGRGAAPAAKYTLNLPNGEQRQLSLGALAGGASVTIPINPPIQVTAKDGLRGFSYNLRLDRVNMDTRAPDQFEVQQPVQLTSVSLDPLTTLNPQKDLVLQIKNVSKRDYGAEGDVKRTINVRLGSVGSKWPPLAQINGQFVPLDKPLDIAVPVVKAGDTVTLKIPVKASSGWKPGSAATVLATMTLDQAKVDQKRTVKADYMVDPNGPIKNSYDLNGAGVFCRFAWNVSKSGIVGVNIDKAAKNDGIVVNIKLDGGRLSPAYAISMENLPYQFRDRLLHEQPIEGFMWTDLLKTLVPPSSSMWSGWKLKSCEVESAKVKVPAVRKSGESSDATDSASDLPGDGDPHANDAR
ncbi:MAG: COG1470 family protein [Bdellovibrionota bacterium]